MGRKAHHYRMLQRNLVTALFRHERIVTTEQKAKEFRSIAENLITKSRENNLHHFRQVLSIIQDKEITQKLFKEIAPLFKDRPGGYTRIIKLGGTRPDMKGGKNMGKWASNRLKDNAQRVIWELVVKSKPETKEEKKGKAKPKTKEKAKEKPKEGETAHKEKEKAKAKA